MVEETILLSKIIKSPNTVPANNEIKTITIKNLFEKNDFQPIDQEVDEQSVEVEQKDPTNEELVKKMEEQLLEAEARAKQIIADAESAFSAKSKKSFN